MIKLLVAVALILLAPRCGLDVRILLHFPHPTGAEFVTIGRDLRSFGSLALRILPAPCAEVEIEWEDTSGLRHAAFTEHPDMIGSGAYVASVRQNVNNYYPERRNAWEVIIYSANLDGDPLTRDRLPHRIEMPFIHFTMREGPDCEQPAPFENDYWHNAWLFAGFAGPDPFTPYVVGGENNGLSTSARWYTSWPEVPCENAPLPGYCATDHEDGGRLRAMIERHRVNAGETRVFKELAEISCDDATSLNQPCIGVVK